MIVVPIRYKTFHSSCLLLLDFVVAKPTYLSLDGGVGPPFDNELRAQRVFDQLLIANRSGNVEQLPGKRIEHIVKR